MQRVDVAVGVHRAGRRHQRLARHLAAEHALAVLVGLGAAEDVDLDRFEIEQLDEVAQRVRHGGHSARTHPASCTGFVRSRQNSTTSVTESVPVSLPCRPRWLIVQIVSSITRLRWMLVRQSSFG